jgi:hypothetical protein
MIKKLNVPYSSQRENKFNWGDDYPYKDPSDTAFRTCGITCLTMVLHYYGLTKMTTDDILKELHTPGMNLNRLYTERAPGDSSNGNICDTWGDGTKESLVGSFAPLTNPINLARIANYFLDKAGKTNYLKSPYDTCDQGRALSIAKAKDFLARGIPVIIHGGFTDPSREGAGHYVLLRGFTDNSFFINDPYGDPRINANSVKLDIIPKGGNIDETCNYKDKPSSKNNPNTGKRYGEDIEIEISSLKTILLHDEVFINFIAVEGPVPNILNFPTDGERPSLPLHWYHKSEMVPGGFYPIARNRCAHGGVHLCGNGTIMFAKAMAPGYVVAFRFFSLYTEKKFNANHNQKLVQEDGSAYFVDPSYSSFVLIRHEITDVPEKKDTPKKKMPIYSLYMNLAPIDSPELLEKIPWFKQLCDLLKGGSSSIEYETLGEIEWKDNDKKLYRTARASLDPLSSLTVTEGIPLIKGEEGKVVTLSQPILKVGTGEVIGCSKKMDTDITNFIHWEIFSPASEDSLKKIVDLYIKNKGGINVKEIKEDDNFLTKDELAKIFTDINLSEIFSLVFVEVTSDWSKIIAGTQLSKINPFFDTNILRNYRDKPIPFSYWLYLNFLKNDSYEVVISANWTSSYDIEKTKKLYIRCAMGSYTDEKAIAFLKGEKSGSTYTFYLPSIGDEEEKGKIDALPLSIDEFKKGINVKLPIHAREIIIEQKDEDKVLKSATLDSSEGEKALFEKEVDKHLRNFKLTHKPEWTNESIKSLITALKENGIISKGYNYTDDDFSEITWLDEKKEFMIYDSLFGSKGYIPAASEFVHLHPATAAWMLSLLYKGEKIGFDESVIPEEFKKKNPLKYYAFSVESAKSTCVLGDPIRLFVAAEFIRPDNTPRTFAMPDSTGDKYTITLDQYGQWRMDFTLDYWGTYKFETESPEFIDKKPVKGELIEEIKIEKPVLTKLFLKDSTEESASKNFVRKMFIQFQDSSTTPIFLQAVLYFQFGKAAKREDITDWKEFEKGQLLGFAVEPEPVSGQLKSSYEPQELYKEIITKAGTLAAGQSIFLKVKAVSPNGGLKKIDVALTRNKAEAGNTVIAKKRADLIKGKAITSLPEDEGFLDFEDSLMFPYLNAPEKPVLEISERGPEVRALGYAVFGNEAYKWTTIKDFAVTAQILDNNDAIKFDKIVASETVIRQKDGENILEAFIDLKADYFSKDKTKPNKIKYKFSYPPKSPTMEATCTFTLENPDITDFTCTKDETSGEMMITGTKKNIPEWMIINLKIEWKGNDQDIVSVSWTLFCPEVATPDDTIRFTVPSDQYISNKCKLTFYPEIKDITAFPQEIKIEEEQNTGTSSTKFKTKKITMDVKFRKEAKDESEWYFGLGTGKIVRSILDSEGNSIIRDGGKAKYEYVEFSDTDKKTSHKGWINTVGLK